MRVKNSIKLDYDKKMETFKEELKIEREREIETLKSQLQIAASTHQIQFATLHAKIAETVAEIYGRIIKLRSAIDKYVKAIDTESRDLRLVELFDAMDSFDTYYLPNKIILPKNCINKIGKFESVLYGIGGEYAQQVENPGKDVALDAKAFEQAKRKMEEIVPSVLESLEDEFRKLLGHNNAEAVPVKENTQEA